MRKIIGFSGRKRSGKDTLCAAVAGTEKNSHIFVVANALKRLCCELLGVDLETLNRLKDSPDPEFIMPLPDVRWCRIVQQRLGVGADTIEPMLLNRPIADVRELLQVLGTDIIRRLNPDWHIDQVIKEIESYPDDTVCLVSDIRFPVELEKLRAIGADVFFIVRPHCMDISNHESETSLGWRDFDEDHIIINDCPLDAFVDAFMTAYIQGDMKGLSTNYTNLKHGYTADTRVFRDSDKNPWFNGMFHNMALQNPKDRVATCGTLTLSNVYRGVAKMILKGDMDGGTDDLVNISFYNPLFIEELKLHWK